jgi:hypothetical protein
MKWPWRKDECEHHLCECGGIKTRQTTLEEFGFEFISESQTRLTDFDKQMFEPVAVTTESVGLEGETRKYRGNI